MRSCDHINIHIHQTLGGTDDAHHHGDYMYTPIVKEQFYNVLLSNISIAGTMLPLECSEVSGDHIVMVTWLLW